YHDPSAGELPWFYSLGGTRDDDLLVADEVLACARASVGIDTRRIYSVGFSAGAIHNTQFAARRSGYVASIVVYSGARLSTPDEQDSTNLYPALLFHGGPTDQVFLAFDKTTLQYQQALEDEGHTAIVCNHGMGHTVPADGRAASWQFLQDHPFAESPEPYKDGLPAVFPGYCMP
ncbi:MAG TPA: dienelactone hydrolase family protein, partial [Polyangium sp.]|nr:dienelactone hydrolase family protein [Polyangium sp.]